MRLEHEAAPVGDREKRRFTLRRSAMHSSSRNISAFIGTIRDRNPPSPRCVRPWCESDTLNAALASDLDPLIAQYQPPLWVHGHRPGWRVEAGCLGLLDDGEFLGGGFAVASGPDFEADSLSFGEAWNTV